MALISGLLQLQEFETEELKVKVILAAAQNRILAIAQIHELLYHSKSFNKIDFDSFLESHINKLSQSLTNPYAFDYHLDVKPAVLNINQAIHCALLFNEALLLCIKHAVRQVDYPKIVIILRQVEERLNLTIKGDFPANAIPNKFPNEDRLSLDLIHNLKRQLEAKMHRSKGQYFSWHISFDIQETKGVGCSRVFEETSALGRATFE